MIRVLIVDDEPLARGLLRARLANESDIAVVAEADSGVSAISLARVHEPAVIFMDVQMPAMDGIRAVENIRDFLQPEVVFVTAHDLYAVRAFEAGALDYLMKPVTSQRLALTMSRLRERLRGAPPASASAPQPGLAQPIVDTPQLPPGASSEWIVVPTEGRFRVLALADVLWLEADGNYVQVVTDEGAYRLRGPLSAIEATLPPQRFARVHRSRVVNIAKLREIVPVQHGDFDLILAGGKRLRMSRTFRWRLL